MIIALVMRNVTVRLVLISILVVLRVSKRKYMPSNEIIKMDVPY